MLSSRGSASKPEMKGNVNCRMALSSASPGISSGRIVERSEMLAGPPNKDDWSVGVFAPSSRPKLGKERPVGVLTSVFTSVASARTISPNRFSLNRPFSQPLVKHWLTVDLFAGSNFNMGLRMSMIWSLFSSRLSSCLKTALHHVEVCGSWWKFGRS